MWTILPHAARSFSASIVVLPPENARVVAVAYLYARILDTYEDLLPEPGDRPAALTAFAARLRSRPHPEPRPISDALAVDDRDRVHLLLVTKIDLIDAVYADLRPDHQRAIADLIESMAEGMAWSSRRFVEQGGVLADDDQLRRYCHNVIGHPAAFVIRLLSDARTDTDRDAFAMSEMIQLANITRDLEKDLERGIAYDPILRPHLGGAHASTVRDVRERLVGLALSKAPAFRRLYVGAGLLRRPATRLAAVLMLLFTDLHYRSMIRQVGLSPWRGPAGKVAVVATALPSLASSRYAAKVVCRVTERFEHAATVIDRRRVPARHSFD